MQLDFEFIIGRRLTKMWYVLWWFVPLVLFAFFIWELVTIPSNGMLDDDPIWMYGVGFGVLLIALVFILTIGFYTVYQQDEYFTLADVSTQKIISFLINLPYFICNFSETYSFIKTSKKMGTS